MCASLLATEAAIINNFLLNNYWTFESRNYSKSLLYRYIVFNLTSLGSLIVNFGLFGLLTTLEVWYITAQVAGILSAFGINYFINSRITFHGKKSILLKT